MYIRSIDIVNFRCFDNAQCEFQFPGRKIPGTQDPAARPGLRNLNLILGDNGSGKSTLLQAIALSILGTVLPSSGFRPYYLVRAKSAVGKDLASVESKLVVSANDLALERGLPRSGGAEVQATLVARTVIERFATENQIGPQTNMRFPDTDPIRLDVLHDSLRERENPAFFICAYGATRRSEDTALYDEAARTKQRSVRYQRIASLFEEQYSLTSFSAWLRQASSDSTGKPHRIFDFVASTVKQLLVGTGVEWTNEVIDGEAHFRMPDGLTVPFAALSDGFKAYLAWVGDLLRHVGDVCRNQSEAAALQGVVLVDEVDLHLHPTWQRRLLESVAQAFPNLQFIVSSHSPILAGTLPPENILVVERPLEGPATLRMADEDLYGKSISQVLQSPYFKVETTLPPSLEAGAQLRRQQRQQRAREFLKSRDGATARAYVETLLDETNSLQS